MNYNIINSKYVPNIRIFLDYVLFDGNYVEAKKMCGNKFQIEWFKKERMQDKLFKNYMVSS